MRISLHLVAALVLTLIAYACVRRGEGTPPPDDGLAELIADPDDPVHATIYGRVIDERTGEGIEGVTVWLEPEGSNLRHQATSRGDGIFVFLSQPPGTYTVRILSESAAAAEQASVGAGQRWRPRLVIEETLALEPEGARIRPRGRMG
ncbi:MAG: carboxypeptidase-like regulatory domain-containing protein [Nannocystaceae bacterium]